MDDWLIRFADANFRRSADTAHDLKTPLNIAVLNLELLRMRVRKLTDGSDDPKLIEYAAAIELELRRMARVFDAFFLLSTPPKGEEEPKLIDAGRICSDAAVAAGLSIDHCPEAAVFAHESRIRQAFQMFFESATKLFPNARQATGERDGQQLTVTVEGTAPTSDFEASKIFKFYYTDPLGNPDLSMATARLVFETYGGELNATQEGDKVVIRLSLPLGKE